MRIAFMTITAVMFMILIMVALTLDATQSMYPATISATQHGGSFTFSHARWLAGEWSGPNVGPPADQSFDKFVSLKSSHVRLAAQQDEVEVAPGKYDFRALDKRIDKAIAAGAKVILVIGDKTPRGPETHRPGFRPNPTDEDKYRHFDAVMKHYEKNPRIWMIQVENEPFNKDVSVSEKLLAREISRAAKSGKPLMVTLEAGSAVKPWNAWVLPKLIDVLKKNKGKCPGYIGLDLYIRGNINGSVFENGDLHWKMWKGFVQQIKNAGLTPIVAELQGEPWEQDPAKVDFRQQSGNSTFNPAMMKAAAKKAKSLGCPIILLWGTEHWIACEKQGNSAWIKAAESIMKSK